MPIGRPAVDSSAEVTHKIKGQTLLDRAHGLFGEQPVFWGRYFKTPHEVGGVHYNAAVENGPLAARGIRLLPIGQQTEEVNESEAIGRAAARNNVLAYYHSFHPDDLARQSDEFYLYLDVEGHPHASLSAAFWTGWSSELTAYSRQQSNHSVTLLPGLYCNMDPATWSALHSVEAAAPCRSVWLARWVANPPLCLKPPIWMEHHVMPSPAPQAAIHAWQYAAECGGGDGIDPGELSPLLSTADAAAFLQRLILPPA